MTDLTEMTADSSHAPEPSDATRAGVNGRVLFWAAVITVSAAAAYIVARSMWGRREQDPTSTRIQSLIDEANQLLRSLDEQKRD
ncbi:MAG TPA: hypothetical protein VNJ51_09245 [Candidatus Dormibacteraeota bacterium]|nr:hypothetical protein [Candidatus Dormibacteraeota bacterium]